MSRSIQQQIESLRETIRRLDRLYYVEAAPGATDVEYDRMIRELKSLDPKSVVFYASGRASLEASYMWALLARLASRPAGASPRLLRPGAWRLLRPL